MNHDSLIDTIQRLLALGKSPNRHEAALAVAKAHELLAKHDLSMEDVSTEEIGREWTEEHVWQGRRLPLSFDFVVSFCSTYFFVRCIRERIGPASSVVFLGRPHHVAIAKHVFVYLTRTFADRWKAYKAPWTPANEEKVYYNGIYRGLCDKMDQARRDRRFDADRRGALVTSMDAQVSAELERRYGKLRKKRQVVARGTEESYYAGIAAGMRMEIRPAVDQAADARPMIGRAD